MPITPFARRRGWQPCDRSPDIGPGGAPQFCASGSSCFPRPAASFLIHARRVRAEVDERDVGRVHAGQRVRVTVDAFPDHPFSGTVGQIGSLMGRKTVRSGDPAEKADRDVLDVLVDIDQPDPGLVIGLRVTVSFLE